MSGTWILDHFLGGPGSFTDCADLAAEGQRAFETALLQVTAWLHEQTGAQDLVFAGGTALNCSANGRGSCARAPSTTCSSRPAPTTAAPRWAARCTG